MEMDEIEKVTPVEKIVVYGQYFTGSTFAISVYVGETRCKSVHVIERGQAISCFISNLATTSAQNVFVVVCVNDLCSNKAKLFYHAHVMKVYPRYITENSNAVISIKGYGFKPSSYCVVIVHRHGSSFENVVKIHTSYISSKEILCTFPNMHIIGQSYYIDVADSVNIAINGWHPKTAWCMESRCRLIVLRKNELLAIYPNVGNLNQHISINASFDIRNAANITGMRGSRLAAIATAQKHGIAPGQNIYCELFLP